MDLVGRRFQWAQGDYVNLAQLDPEIKALIKRGMWLLDPERAAAWSTLSQNDVFAAVMDQFGGSLVLTRTEARRYMEAGKKSRNNNSKELGTC